MKATTNPHNEQTFQQSKKAASELRQLSYGDGIRGYTE